MNEHSVVSVSDRRVSAHPLSCLDGAANQAFRRAATNSRSNELPHFADIEPARAWLLATQGELLLIDVRTDEERQLTGQIPGALHIPWEITPGQCLNPSFLLQLRSSARPEHPLAFICRSGRRSKAAAAAASVGGFAHTRNVLGGVEGESAAEGGRSHHYGWKKLGLPWTQA